MFHWVLWTYEKVNVVIFVNFYFVLKRRRYLIELPLFAGLLTQYQNRLILGDLDTILYQWLPGVLLLFNLQTLVCCWCHWWNTLVFLHFEYNFLFRFELSSVIVISEFKPFDGCLSLLHYLLQTLNLLSLFLLSAGLHPHVLIEIIRKFFWRTPLSHFYQEL